VVGNTAKSAFLVSWLEIHPARNFSKYVFPDGTFGSVSIQSEHLPKLIIAEKVDI